MGTEAINFAYYILLSKERNKVIDGQNYEGFGSFGDFRSC